MNTAILTRFTFVKQFAKFFIVGIMNTGVDLVVLNILMFVSQHSEGAYYSVFKTMSFTTAVVFSYFINKKWTFQDKAKENSNKKFYQFIAVSLVGAIINVTTATIVVSAIKPLIGTDLISGQLWGNIGAICGTAVGLIWNFLGYKFFVFKK